MLFTAVNCSFKATNNMDQGSVVVLCRRSVRFATLIGHADMHRDLNYSGSIPTATTLIPDPASYGKQISLAGHSNAISNILDQGSVLAVHCTKTARKRCDVQHNQKLSQLIRGVQPRILSVLIHN